MSRPILAEYVKAGWALVPIPLGRKGPVIKDWGLKEKCITDPETAEFLDGNVGLVHAHSGTCVVDCDDLEGAIAWFGERGVDLQGLLDAPGSVQIVSGRPNRAKLLYKVDKPLSTFKVGPFELRCAPSRGGSAIQDVLPPSIHPDTGQPYEWKFDDAFADWSCPLPLPAEIRAIWEGMCKPDMRPAPPRVRSANLGVARDYLFRHDPDEDYDNWLKAGMALHDETDGGLDGLDLWDEWSKRGSKYKSREDLETHWRSFHRDSNNPVTIASLRVDQAAELEEFSIVTQEDTANLPVPKTSSALREAINSLKRDATGKALAALPNVLTIISLPEICGQRLAHDDFRDSLVCAPNGTDNWRPIKDTDYTAFRVWLEESARFYPVSKDLVRDAIYYIAEAQKMDSAQDWLSKLKWDGVPRIREYCPQYLGTVAAPYERAIGEYLWTALAGRVMSPGCQADMAVILVGSQGLGKSRGVQAMAPWKDAYVEVKLDENEDTIARKLRGVLVGELAELRGLFRNADLERTLAFITRPDEKWIPKYMEFATTFARRCIFIGTTNEEEFLPPGENRRWLVVRTAGVDVEAITRDRDQLWAEGLARWMEDGILWKDAETMAKDNQADFKVTDQWEPIIEQWLTDNPGANRFKAHDILVQALGLDIRTINRAHEQRVCSVLRSLGFERQSIRGKDKKVYRGWVKQTLDI